MTEPKFSKLILCTLVNDNVEELIRTYRSILTQNCKVTWVIISPERNIHVANLITQWKDANIVDLVLSDSGKGIYPAMNFAISVLPSESWIWFLNAGDEFSACDSYGNIRKQIETDPRPWYFGGFLLADTNQLIVRKFNAPEKFEIKNQLFSRKFINHQSFICSNNLLRKVGGFDENFKIASDWDLICRISKLAPGRRIPEHLVIFHLGGISTHLRNVANRELKIIRKRHLPKKYVLVSNLWYFYRFFRNHLVLCFENRFPKLTHLYRNLRFDLQRKLDEG